MADPISATLITMTLVSAGASIAGGISANRAANREASALEEQGRIAREEANREAQLHAADVRRFQRTQAVAFTKNGVTLAGSPLLVLDDTVARGQEEVDSIVRSGDAQGRLYNQNASQARSKGRSALLGGIVSAGTSVALAGMKIPKAPSQDQVFMNPIPFRDY